MAANRSSRHLLRISRKRRWCAADAMGALRAYRASGLPLARFARERGLPLHRLTWWRRGLEPAEGAKAAAPAPLTFLPVTLSGPPSEHPAGVEILLAEGHRIRLLPDFDVATLARAIEILERTAC